MRSHTHTCPSCGEDIECSAGPVSDGDRIVCCEAEYDHRGPLICAECEMSRCEDCGAYPGQPHDADCEATA